VNIDAPKQALSDFTRRAGMLLALASCAYLGYVAWQAMQAPDAAAIALPPLGRWLAAISACTLAMAMLALGWHFALRAAGVPSAVASAAAAYAMSQPAKYLPGNVLHFASRHMLGRTQGHGHGALVKASILEAISLIGVAMFIAGISHWQELPGISAMPSVLPGAWIITLLAVALLGVGALVRQGTRIGELGWLALHAACALSYFLLTTLAFWLLAESALSTLSPVQLLSPIALSWVGGFVIIGAPGGIGVREALLLQFFAGSAPAAGLLAIAIVFRVSLVAADFLLFALAWCCGHRRAEH
jgi:hypothetical protein